MHRYPWLRDRLDQCVVADGRTYVWAGSHGTTRVLGLALLCVGKAVRWSVAWADFVIRLNVEDAFLVDQPVSFFPTSLARLGPTQLSASAASKRLQRSRGYVTRGVQDVLDDWQTNGSLREGTHVFVLHEALAAPVCRKLLSALPWPLSWKVAKLAARDHPQPRTASFDSEDRASALSFPRILCCAGVGASHEGTSEFAHHWRGNVRASWGARLPHLHEQLHGYCAVCMMREVPIELFVQSWR